MPWDWVLVIPGMFGLYLTTKKLVAGFVVGASVQVLWMAYGLSTSQYGFVLSALGYGYVNLLGLYRWTRPKKAKNETVSRAARLYFQTARAYDPTRDLHHWVVRAPNGNFLYSSRSYYKTEDEAVENCVASLGSDIVDEEVFIIEALPQVREKVYVEFHRVTTQRLRERKGRSL